MTFRASRDGRSNQQSTKQGAFEGAHARGERSGKSAITESWVKPDGSVERNVRMELVIAAAKKVPEPQP